MVTSINFNSKNSFTDFDLILKKRPIIPVTLEDVKSISIEGRSGTLTRRMGTYKDKVIPCEFALLSKNGLRARVDSIIAWFNYITDRNFYFSYDPDVIYKVKSIAIEDNIQEVLKRYGEFEAVFTCEPFKYPTSESTITKTDTSFTITNSGTVKTEPYIKITGSGTITLTVNGNAVTFTGVDTYIEIDSLYLLCYKGSTNEMLKMSGKFPVFDIGSNSVSLTGTVTQVDILVRTKYL